MVYENWVNSELNYRMNRRAWFCFVFLLLENAYCVPRLGVHDAAEVVAKLVGHLHEISSGIDSLALNKRRQIHR